jgi:hypothetical protein
MFAHKVTTSFVEPRWWGADAAIDCIVIRCSLNVPQPPATPRRLKEMGRDADWGLTMDQDYIWWGGTVLACLITFALGFIAGMRLSWVGLKLDGIDRNLDGMRTFLGTTLKGTRRRIARIEAKLDAFGARQAGLIEKLERRPEQGIGESAQPE